jgi:hypothetical protein
MVVETYLMFNHYFVYTFQREEGEET